MTPDATDVMLGPDWSRVSLLSTVLGCQADNLPAIKADGRLRLAGQPSGKVKAEITHRGGTGEGMVWLQDGDMSSVAEESGRGNTKIPNCEKAKKRASN